MNLVAIIEVTEQCNLGCTHCLRPSFNLPVMSERTLEKVIKHLLEFGKKRVDFVWHGGEPLLAKIDFFEKVVEFQEKYNSKKVQIVNNVQTNGTTLTNNFADFFDRYNFSIGTSIQGTKDMHDVTRITKNGLSTYDIVLDNIAKLSSKPSCIVVLTKGVLDREEEVYNSIKPHVRGVRISEYFPNGKTNFGEVDPEMPTPEEYGESMIKFYEVWKNDLDPIDLRPITEIIRSFVVGHSEGCLYSQEVCSHSILGVKSTGEFYLCIRGAPEKKFSLGLVDEKPLERYELLAENFNQERLINTLEKLCETCVFWKYCNGGCPLESWKLYGDLNHKTYYCEGRKMLFKAIAKDMKIK